LIRIESPQSWSEDEPTAGFSCTRFAGTKKPSLSPSNRHKKKTPEDELKAKSERGTFEQNHEKVSPKCKERNGRDQKKKEISPLRLDGGGKGARQLKAPPRANVRTAKTSEKGGHTYFNRGR